MTETTTTTLHTCTAEEFDHTPAHLRTLNCPRCQELREHYREES